jgi:hypothetical protein
MSRKYATILLAALVLTGSMGLKTVLGAHSTDTVLMANGSAPAPAPWKDTLTAGPLQNGSAPAPAPWKDTLTAGSLRNGSAPAPAPWKDTVTAVRNGSAPAPAPWKDTLTATTPKSW